MNIINNLVLPPTFYIGINLQILSNKKCLNSYRYNKMDCSLPRINCLKCKEVKTKSISQFAIFLLVLWKCFPVSYIFVKISKILFHLIFIVYKCRTTAQSQLSWEEKKILNFPNFCPFPVFFELTTIPLVKSVVIQWNFLTVTATKNFHWYRFAIFLSNLRIFFSFISDCSCGWAKNHGAKICFQNTQLPLNGTCRIFKIRNNIYAVLLWHWIRKAMQIIYWSTYQKPQ